MHKTKEIKKIRRISKIYKKSQRISNITQKNLLKQGKNDKKIYESRKLLKKT